MSGGAAHELTGIAIANESGERSLKGSLPFCVKNFPEAPAPVSQAQQSCPYFAGVGLLAGSE